HAEPFADGCPRLGMERRPRRACAGRYRLLVWCVQVAGLAPRARELHPGRAGRRDTNEARPDDTTLSGVIGGNGDTVCLQDRNERRVDGARIEGLLAGAE